MMFRQLFDPESSTYTYLLADELEKAAVLIDPVREQAERDLEILRELGLELRYVLETHVHADHVSGAATLRDKTGAKVVLSKAASCDCADVAVRDGDTIQVGRHTIRVIETPGHTDGCVSYLADGRVFTGDALLIRGSGRTDFQQGSNEKLYHSVTKKLFALPPETLVYPGHDYKGRTVSTIGEEIAHNPRLGRNKSFEEFAAIMANLKLGMPKKIQEAVPANLACGLTREEAEANARKRKLEALAPVRSPEGVLEVPHKALETAAREGVRIVDVREVEELTGALPKLDVAASVPLATLASVAAPWSRAEPVVLICRSGVRSARAAKLLESMGFVAALSLRGGMREIAEAQDAQRGRRVAR